MGKNLGEGDYTGITRAKRLRHNGPTRRQRAVKPGAMPKARAPAGAAPRNN